ncbi:hypothetical protein OOT46_20170 [Aquabacterium sp. A7-Y]|uniref:hypothetical protein n=1 Tax=Aquabacterium sp. A7-Y TaxID=1349605 RepID=UPI00223D05AD|nr:hypothetical protein [Aquabacterium sp. A7-Y]MCW7540153.1 hypothetical protein [Aquabacterium sp. A7-Y]
MVDPRNTKFLDQELASLEVAASNFAARFIPDAKVRQDYITQTQAYAQELRSRVLRGIQSPQSAATEAQQMRNTIMNAMRGRTSDFGLALAQFMKKEGKSLAQLEGKYADELFKKSFGALDSTRQRAVWLKIVEKSGQPQKLASMGARAMGYAGRGLFALTAVIAVYHVAQAEDKLEAGAREAVSIAGGFAGGAALGAAGGAFCGPAAIACVPLGVFVGGILGALGADALFTAVWR